MTARILFSIVLIGLSAWSLGQSVQSASLPSETALLRKAPASVVNIEESIHELRARDLDDAGTTGEGDVLTTPTTSSSGTGSTCSPAAPQLSQSGTSITANYNDPCGNPVKRAVHDYTLQRADGGASTYNTVFQTTATTWSHTDDGLNAGTSYSYKVCDHSVCGPAVSITVSGGASDVQNSANSAGSSSVGLAPWLIGLIVAIIVIIIIAIIITIILVRRRQKQKQQKPVVADVAAPVGVMPTISVSSDDEEVSVSEEEWYRAGGLEEEARARDFNDLIGEYKAHRVLKRKGDSDSDSWDDSDEEEWARLTSAATVIQAFWRGYLVRHPRAGPMSASRVEYLQSLVAGFNIDMDEQSMFDLLESIQRASRDIWEEDEVPADIADAINLLAMAARNLLSIDDKDSEEYKAAEAAFLAQKKILEDRLALFSSGEHESASYKHRTRSWGAFKNLLREYRNKKSALEEAPNSEVAQKELLEQFRTHAESLLPTDDMDTEETENSDSMDSQSSSRSSGSWQDMKAMIQKYRNGRAMPVAGAEAAPVSRAKAADRWKDRAAILAKLEGALTEGNFDKLRGVKAVPKPQIHLAAISEAEANPLESAPMPWMTRQTGSHNVKFEEEESEDSGDASDSAENSADSNSAENSMDSTGSRASGVGSPLVKVNPIKFNRRMLRPRGNAAQDVAAASRRRTGLASDNSGNSTTSPENSSEMSLEDASQDVPAVASEANQMPVSNSPRVLRRRVRKSGDGSSVVSRGSAAAEEEIVA